ncbi:hypothetical protein K1T71_003394 [Dendrolimus kikuchii]|uniref:Uncharacterized protein n=1 Tax=Dendrolimus kikuchii TaxID=765133 RepID=A0ACC1DBG3_9NEOP|nr:hypothetical protein K1T71_003394 [Dendrolimus kikuchii]
MFLNCTNNVGRRLDVERARLRGNCCNHLVVINKPIIKMRAPRLWLAVLGFVCVTSVVQPAAVPTDTVVVANSNDVSMTVHQ